MNQKRIAVLGLGMMGHGIALNLMRRGFSVCGYDVRRESMERFAAAGGSCAASCREAGKDADAVVLMVFDETQLRDILFGADALVPVLKPGCTLIVTASVGRDVLEEADAKLRETGVLLVDAAVRASAASAAAGDMYIMAAGSGEAMAAVDDVLHAMGSTVYRVSDKPGMAQVAKSCMQAFFSLTFEMTAEILSMGCAAGLDPAVVYGILDATSASNGIFRATAANIASGTFQGTNNPMAILEKDANLAVRLAHDKGLRLPALEGTAENFAACMREHPQDDIWACVKSFEKSAGIQVRFDVEKA